MLQFPFIGDGAVLVAVDQVMRVLEGLAVLGVELLDFRQLARISAVN